MIYIYIYRYMYMVQVISGNIISLILFMVDITIVNGGYNGL